MSVVSHHRRVVPSIAIAALLLVSGCVSAFTNGAGDWTPDEGEPTCHPELGVAADIGLLALGLAAAPDLVLGGALAGETTFAIGVTGAVFAIGGPVIGVIGGGVKMHSCSRAKAKWRHLRRHPDMVAVTNTDDSISALDVLNDIAVQTGGEVDVYGDTLIVRMPRVDSCTTSGWFHEVSAHRAALAAHGITHASCRVGKVTVWDGELPTASNL
jgi:hypothetical protein